MSNLQSLKPQQNRLHSLDIFRGITVAAMILVNTPGDWDHIYAPLKHAAWNGCTPTDVIFPAFLFMMGVAIVYAFQKKKAAGAKQLQLLLTAVKRCLILIFLGLFISFIYRPDFSHLRYPGVLQRIAIVYLIVVLLYLNTQLKTLVAVSAFILIGYYLIMNFIPLPDGHAANLNAGTDLSAYIDRAIFSTNHLNRFTKTWDAMGLLTTLPALVSCLAGVFAGEILKNSKNSVEIKALNLFVLGTVLTLMGLATGLFFPINKSLWTSSYVLYTGGISMLGLALIYWLADIRQYQQYFSPFLVFGVNALSAYVLSECLPKFIDLLRFNFYGQPVSGMKILNQYALSLGVLPVNASLISAVIYTILIWLLMYPLYLTKKSK